MGEKHGFDHIRICSWRIEKTSGEFAGYPIQIVHLLEDHPKRCYFKDPKPFFTMLRLFCTAIALLGILLQIRR
ncbi:hypothetical protein ES703_29753 [subsurface metagenome]